ncbi:glycosyltransferase family 2 protein [Lactiplantibacillus pentosus]|uniref:glycosyltransferase family 2 protein n=1 Tax=Lactiplantibacillus pentosus TaxID=1589 RepID=UPI001C1F0D13|nr:glycosyltransferase family 2 protein [Lactiplantibacillus pentosus]MBU7465862.1 glycosyltransferase family 2 protein [Lactiplantibacillus pentosus]MBU7491714.1 glycosyltransferase family 2 protein [Lactiplantibacillus pentosus]MBU7494745.1 glycosyltransferase family 2 protein [Lactiplantibacillus pentosus]MBU7520747.1 glycosyltransferase family 2 protein [Lactiplantibacillus pentosus]MBU7527460.1 glycosyltransferase family 2 protein [Lactiplantibacillus pentosus]
MNKIEVSVILPVYNSQQFVRTAIDSVLGQSLKAFELIIVNDASTDDTEKIVHSYDDQRIVYIRLKNNSGVATARNTGIKLARGKFIAFIDSDDFWSKEKLQRQISFMNENKINFSYSNYSLMNIRGKVIKRINNLPKKNTYQSLLKTNSIPLLTVIIDRRLIRQYGFLDIHHEDYATWLQILRETGECAILHPQITAYYRVRENSVSSNKLKSLSWTWQIYRKSEHISIVKSIYFLACNAVHGLLKHQRVIKYE